MPPSHAHGSFGGTLQRLRLAAALSQEELAERAGVSARAISDLERGVRQGPRASTLRMLADALVLTDRERAALVAAAHAERRSTLSSMPRDFPSRLLRPPTPLFGREQEVEAISALMSREGVRLVTLTGTGGIGKTRLAIEIATRLAETMRIDALFVDLAPLSDPALVMPTIAGSLGVRDIPGQSATQTVITTLGDRQALLVLDNCEHLLGTVPELVEILANCRALLLLATSREALKIRGEREWPIGPLSLPNLDKLPPVAELAGVPAIAVFRERALASDPVFSLSAENARAVARICHRVEGIPLAIELAAARIKLLSPEVLADRLEQRLPLLSSGARDAPPRHQTLRAALAWSYDLLCPDEQAMFRRLGVFAGGWTIEAAGRVVEPADDTALLTTLASLLDKSLILVDRDDEGPRYRMLESMREFALERLDAAGEGPAARDRHAAYFLELAHHASPEMSGADQTSGLRRLEREHPNLSEAFATMAAHGDDTGYSHLTRALFNFWFCHAHAREALERFKHVLGRAPAMSRDRAWALFGAGGLAFGCGEFAMAERWLTEAETLAQHWGDETLLAQCALHRGGVAEEQDDDEAAGILFAAALTHARNANDAWLVAEVLPNLSDLAYRRGDMETAERIAREALPILRATGNAYMESMTMGGLAQVALARGEIGIAAEGFAEGMRIAQETASRWNVANCLGGAAAIGAALGDHDRAARLLGAADGERERSGHARIPQFALFAQSEARVRRAIGETRYLSAWSAGRAIPVEVAVEKAWAVFRDGQGQAASPRSTRQG